MTLPLPVCGCGRTLPRPLKPLWPATVYCPCGAARTFPSPRSEKQKEHIKRIGLATRLTKGARKGRVSEASAAVTVSTPTPTPIDPVEVVLRSHRANSTAKDGRGEGRLDGEPVE